MYSPPPLLPSPSNCTPLLHSIVRTYLSFMGSNYLEPFCSCCYVLVLFPERTGNPCFLETMDYALSDRPIRDWSWYVSLKYHNKYHFWLRNLGFVYVASWDYFTSTYAPQLPHVGTCAGEPLAAVAGDVILSSYLVLFISFYISTYKKMTKLRSVGKVAQKVELKLEKEVDVPIAHSAE